MFLNTQPHAPLAVAFDHVASEEKEVFDSRQINKDLVFNDTFSVVGHSLDLKMRMLFDRFLGEFVLKQ